MYSEKVTQAKIAFALRTGFLKTEPVFHTRSECDAAVSHLKSNWDEDSQTWKRELTREEIAFIKNERFLCRVSYNYWKTRYCWIKSREDKPIRYTPWVSQTILTDIFSEHEIEGIAIELQALKARQLGVSREVSLAQLHRVQFFSHINAMMASSAPAKTAKLGDMLAFTLGYQPHWLLPRFAFGPREHAQHFGGEWFELETGSSLTLQSGYQVTGIARGTTPTVIHISELAEFEYQGLGPEEVIDSSLFRAVHPSARVFMVLESTALGQFNWWHKKWLSSKSGWPTRRSRLRPVFLPWFTGSARLGYIYPEQGFLDRSPVPANYSPALWALEHAKRAEDYVKSNDTLRAYMGSNWTMPREQIWFYEVERQQAVNENRLNKFFQEMPSSDDEAFQSTNVSVFSTETITAHRDRTRAPLGVYGLIGPDMSPRTVLFSRAHIDPNSKPIVIDYPWGAHPHQYELVPLRWDGYATDDGLDKLYIWEMPEDGQIYGLGVDTADGIGKDRSTIEVLRKGSPLQRAGQCAEFASDKINALDLTPYMMALGALFSVKDTDGNRRQCRAAIECRGKGDLSQLGMRIDGWRNFHPWQRIDSKTISPDKVSKLGVFTNEWFRQSIQEYLVKFLRDEEVEILSPFLVSEMQSLESREDVQSFRATYGGHDDRVMSLGFILISLYQYEPNRPVAALTQTKQSRGQVRFERKYASWRPNDQERLTTLDDASV